MDGEYLAYTSRIGSSASVREEVRLRTNATGAEKMLAVRDTIGGTDFRLAVVGTDPRWSPSGRYIAYVRNEAERSRYNVVVYDVHTEVSREFSASCDRCGRPFSWWAPDSDRILVPTGIADGKYMLSLYEAPTDRLYAIGSEARPSVIEGMTIAEEFSETRTRIRELVVGNVLAEWTHTRGTGGYEGVGRQQSFALTRAGVAFAIKTSKSSRAAPNWAQCGAEVYHPALGDKSRCLLGPVDWVAWSPDATQLAVSFRDGFKSNKAENICAVRVYDLPELTERWSRDLTLCGIGMDSPVPVWTSDGRAIQVIPQYTQI